MKQVFPVYRVLAWIDCPGDHDQGFDLIQLGEATNDASEALRLYKKTAVKGEIVEVKLEMETEDDCFDVLQKDEHGNVLNDLHRLPL